jgi:7,8-dihydropterin-6-yl-methyl-4-(beta-D-ribofuranosyl)aminobenzene 5'-phosphate synthase
MTVVVSTLVENSATFGFLGEWGLGLWVSVDGFQLLFDTGMGKTIIHNADRMRIDLSELNALILSHGHVDHTGGVGRVLVRSGAKPVLAHPGIFEKKLSVRADGTARDISMPFTRTDLEEIGARITLVTESMRLAPNIYLSGEVPLPCIRKTRR